MLVLLLPPLLLSAALGRIAPRVARRYRPRAVAPALVAVAVITALATGLALCAVAVLALAEVPAIAGPGHWSAAALQARVPLPLAFGGVAALVAMGLVISAVRQVVRGGRELLSAIRTGRELGPATAGVDLVVLDDEQRAAAYALPGPAGRIVVTSALLRRLDGPERRAVLAHERSHLQHRHYLYVQFAELAAGANPLLRPAARATRLAVERWADEDAVTSVGDRRTVARALAKAGLARRTPPREAALAAAETELAGRVHSLLDPPSARRGRWVVAGLVGAAVLAMSSAVAFGFNAHQLFETAQAAYLAHRG